MTTEGATWLQRECCPERIIMHSCLISSDRFCFRKRFTLVTPWFILSKIDCLLYEARLESTALVPA